MHRILILVALLWVLTGCGGASHALQQAMFGIDCRPDHLQADGQCTPIR